MAIWSKAHAHCGNAGRWRGPSFARWRHFSLRALLGMVAVCAIPCIWLNWRIREFDEQASDIAHLRSIGARVTVRAAKPQWFWGCFPEGRRHDFVDVMGIALKDCVVRETDFISIARMSSLEGLTLEKTSATDEGLLHLAGLTQIRALVIDDPAISHRGLAAFKGLRHLERLVLRGPGIDDQALMVFANHTSIETLGLSRTRVR